VRKRLGLAIGIAGLALAQSSTQTQNPQAPPPPPPPPAQSQPAPLFGGKLGVKSSEKKKESASLGFNGIDPSGKVDAKMLATTATPADETKVQNMATFAAAPADLDAFIRDGGLKKR
jgi:hypothetical protein